MTITLFIYVAVIHFSAAISESDNFPEYVPCERSWYYWGEKCYKGGGRKQHEKISWPRAVERCKSYGGNLVSIASQKEQDFITTFILLDFKAITWIGLNDRDKEGDYRWNDGTVYNYTNWVPGEPLAPLNLHEDCVHMWFDPGNDLMGQWNDLRCEEEHRYVCEVKSNVRKRTPNPVYCSPEEGKGWKLGDSCYHVVSEKKSWQNAEKHCKTYYDGHLVSILDRTEDAFIDYILSDIKEEVWIGIKVQEQLQQKWSSGWYVSYDVFKKEIHFREETCAARKTNNDKRKRKEWITIPCTEQLPFICKKSKANPPVLKLPVAGSYCPTEFAGWRDLGGEYCYYFEQEKVVTFYEALLDCKRKGGNLVSLHSEDESELVLSFVKYSQIGTIIGAGEHNYQRYLYAHTFWIGFLRSWPREEEFLWTDDSAVDYLNWRFDQPGNTNEPCVEVYTNDAGLMYTWGDISCESKRGFICSVKKVLPILMEEDDCTGFCVLKYSHLHEMVSQSADAKKLRGMCY